MNVHKGDYLLWFAHYGSLEFQHSDSLDDAIETVVMLRDCETSTFDQYGCFLDCERVGYGIVADFDARCDELEERRKAEWAAKQAEIQAVKDAAGPDVPRFHIVLSGPKGVGEGLSKYPETVATGLTSDEAIAERDRLEALFGKSRIAVKGPRNG